MTTTQDQPQLDASIRRRAIEDRVLLLSPRVGCWKGHYRIPKDLVAMTIDGKPVDTDKKGITTPYVTMMTDEWPVDPDGVPWKKRFAAILKIRDRVLIKYSIPFEMAGARIVPKARGVEFFAEMIGLTLGKLRHDLKMVEEAGRGHTPEAEHLRQRIRAVLAADKFATDNTPILDETKETQSFAYQWKTTADEFCADLADRSGDHTEYRGHTNIPVNRGAISQIRESLEPREAWEAVQARIPKTAADMRSKFYTNIYPVELATGTSFSGVTADLLQQYRSVVEHAIDTAVEGCIEQVIARPREELCTALANLQDLINRNGRVNAASFRPVYAALEKLRLFDFAMTPDMERQLNDLQGRLDSTVPNTLSATTSAESGFSAALAAVIGEVEDADKQVRDIEQFGKNYRSIQF